jgi:hypothetical protein
MQDVEVNSLQQGRSIRIENCMHVTISVKQLEVEKVDEIGLAMPRRMERQVEGKTSSDRLKVPDFA